MLEILMRNQRIVISRERLVERVWGYDMLGDTNRVDVYIRRIRNKIEADPVTPRYLHTVRGVGYVFRPLEAVATNGEGESEFHNYDDQGGQQTAFTPDIAVSGR